MKQVSVAAAFIMTLATALAGCASETTSSDTYSQLEVNLIIGNTDVTAVSFDLVCDGGFTLSGQFNVNDEQDPPVWSVIMDVPVGDCSLTLTAFDEQGVPLCIGGPKDFTVEEGETVKVNMVLACDVDGGDPLGNVEVDATFEEVPANNCPRLHLLNAVPDEVPAEGTAVTVLVSDKDGDVLTTALTVTGGSFTDPAAQSTTYFCDNATGAQTMFVTVSDGETACDKSTSFDVTCPGVNSCEGVVCEDDGNVCTDAECNQATGECETSNNTNECTAGGGGGELANNGGFETGNLDGWTPFCDGLGTCEATQAEANTGAWSGLVLTSGAPANPLIKQANVGIGIVQPNSEITIRFSLKGSLLGASGVVFAELFSEITPEGVSKAEILGGGPLFPTADWVPYEFTTTTGPDVSNGVTLQLAAICGAVEGCVVEAYFDDVSIVIPGGDGDPGTCSEGICVPNADCSVAGDCPDDGNECTDATCDAGTCGTSNNTNVCDGGNGTCSAGVCVPDSDCSVAGDCPDDGNECTDAVCDAGACGTSNNTNACDGGAGTCSAGVCEPNASCEYTQNFEALTPGDPPQGQPTDLATDGWLVGGNEFESDGTTPVGSYFAFPAPNGGPAFSAVATGEGGAPQGDQQMSIYNDYNNPNHGDGPPDLNRIIEAVVFQERDLVAADVGNTISFTFDAKVGNIEGASTAEAFIQVLDKLGNSFGVIVDDVQITTNLPATWSTFTLSVPIDASLVGQLLQFGGRSRAANFEGSGILYDNMELCSE